VNLFCKGINRPGVVTSVIPASRKLRQEDVKLHSKMKEGGGEERKKEKEIRGMKGGTGGREEGRKNVRNQ
jgi:hypothetical protein